MKTCLTCSGAILEPNKCYGYGGQICHCHVVPNIQKPSDTFHMNPYLGKGQLFDKATNQNLQDLSKATNIPVTDEQSEKNYKYNRQSFKDAPQSRTAAELSICKELLKQLLGVYLHCAENDDAAVYYKDREEVVDAISKFLGIDVENV